MCYHDEKYIIRVRNCAHIAIASIFLSILFDHHYTGVPRIKVAQTHVTWVFGAQEIVDLF